MHSSIVRDPGLWLRGGALLFVLAGILITVYLSQRGPSLAAARLPPLPRLRVTLGLLRGDVNTVGGDTFTVLNGAGQARTVSVDPNTRVEALVSAQADSIAVGDYLTVPAGSRSFTAAITSRRSPPSAPCKERR